MKITVWDKRKVTVYIGGDPEKNQPPVITVEMDSPQIKFDTDKNIMLVNETK
jgi:hypothetical protein